MNSRLTIADVILQDQHSGIISQIHVLRRTHMRRGAALD